MKLLTRATFIRLLNLPDSDAVELTNKQLEQLYLDLRNENAMVGSLCPIKKLDDGERYTQVLTLAGLDTGMQNAIFNLPPELFPSFVMRNSNDLENITLEEDVFYIFIKKTVSRDYSGTSPEKNIRLLESSRILRTNLRANAPEKKLIAVFPKRTKRVSDEFVKLFTTQPMREIVVVKNANVIETVTHSEEEVKKMLEKEHNAT